MRRGGRRYQAVAVDASAMPCGLEPALGVDGRLAAVARRGDGLAVAVVVDVARDEHAVDPAAGVVVGHEVALRVDLEPVLNTSVLGLCPIAMNRPSIGHLALARRVSVSRTRRPSTFASPRTSATSVLVCTSIFGCA